MWWGHLLIVWWNDNYFINISDLQICPWGGAGFSGRGWVTFQRGRSTEQTQMLLPAQSKQDWVMSLRTETNYGLVVGRVVFFWEGNCWGQLGSVNVASDEEWRCWWVLTAEDRLQLVGPPGEWAQCSHHMTLLSLPLPHSRHMTEGFPAWSDEEEGKSPPN